jgi:zinc protease
MRKSFFKLVFFVLLLSMNITAKAGSFHQTGISELTLNNGLKILVKKDTRAPVAMFQIWYRVGSSYEPEGMNGVSHMLEHLMFNTPGNVRLQMGFNQLNLLGAQGNAYTSRDYTFYYHLLEKNHLEVAFQVEAERMQNLIFHQPTFDIEQKVIEEELFTRKSREPQLTAYDELYANSFLFNGYQLPIIGYVDDIRQLTIKQTQDWYRHFYAPDNAVIVVIGDVNERQVFNLAYKYFSAVPASGIKAKTIIREYWPGKPIRVKIPEKTEIPILLMAFKVPVINTAVPLWEAYALDVLAGWFESGTNSRLHKVLIRDKKLAYDISVQYAVMSRQDNLFIIEATPLEGVTLAKLERALFAEIQKSKKELIDLQLLEIIKDQMVSEEIFERDSLYTQAKILGQAEVVGIPWQEDSLYMDRINRVTPKQIQWVLRKYFRPDNKVVVMQESYHTDK